MENQHPENLPQVPGLSPIVPVRPFFPSGKQEFFFGILILVAGCLLCNSLFYGALNLGFAVFSWVVILSTIGYLLSRGCKPTSYSTILLGCSLVLTASFARSDDDPVKFILLCFSLVSTNLGLCLLAGQGRRNPRGFLSLLDVPRTVLILGMGHLVPAFYGLKLAFREGGTASKKFGAVAVGVMLSVPLLAIVIPLLIRADAAFDGLLQQLPDWDFAELFISILFGTLLACYLYARGTALYHAPKCAPAAKTCKGINPLTVNTVLVAVDIVYLVYLISQLAYFAGGFSGILPEAYTMAEYARRGFFEMGWLCAINLSVIALAIGLTSGNATAPMLSKLLCLFLGIVTLFLVASASAKMFLYIDAFGLTRLRVLTEVIMIWLGLSTLILCFWLFIPKIAYMKLILLLALIMGAATGWADVDTVVARYNVNAYFSGKLETVDVIYLGSLGSGATPYLQQLSQAEDPKVFSPATSQINTRSNESAVTDIRDWNYADHRSDTLLSP